jgi:hypothetical protein
MEHFSQFLCNVTSYYLHIVQLFEVEQQIAEWRKELTMRELFLISFVWLWERSHEPAPKNVGFHWIMQTAVKRWCIDVPLIKYRENYGCQRIDPSSRQVLRWHAREARSHAHRAGGPSEFERV